MDQKRLNDLVAAIREGVSAHGNSMLEFLRAIVAIPSYDGAIGAVAARVEAELSALGFTDIHYAAYGDLVAQIGRGPRVLLYDSHLDTVMAGDPKEWRHPPYAAEVDDGRLFGRGACDEKGSTPPMIYGLALAHRLGLLADFTAIYFGSIEEWCEGLSARVFAETEGVRPEVVVIGEPTDLRVCRGQKGRMEFRVTARGRSAHGALHWLGDNAVYKMQEVIAAVRALDVRLPQDPFLGRASIVVTHVESRESSNNAVPDRCSVVLDRRLIFGETGEEALSQVRALVPAREDFEVEVLRYDRPSYNGYRRTVDQYFPAWSFSEDHPLVRAGLRASAALGLDAKTTCKWDFSTNGAYWAGAAGIPSIGFGPGDPSVAHTVDESICLDDVVRAAEWYALLPAALA